MDIIDALNPFRAMTTAEKIKYVAIGIAAGFVLGRLL